jgi:hypothetical protein
MAALRKYMSLLPLLLTLSLALAGQFSVNRIDITPPVDKEKLDAVIAYVPLLLAPLLFTYACPRPTVVGIVGVPVNVGEARSALVANLFFILVHNVAKVEENLVTFTVLSDVGKAIISLLVQKLAHFLEL